MNEKFPTAEMNLSLALELENLHSNLVLNLNIPDQNNLSVIFLGPFVQFTLMKNKKNWKVVLDVLHCSSSTSIVMTVDSIFFFP